MGPLPRNPNGSGLAATQPSLATGLLVPVSRAQGSEATLSILHDSRHDRTIEYPPHPSLILISFTETF
jgi:hypothetical protein